MHCTNNITKLYIFAATNNSNTYDFVSFRIHVNAAIVFDELFKINVFPNTNTRHWRSTYKPYIRTNHCILYIKKNAGIAC